MFVLVPFFLFRSQSCYSFVGTSWIRRISSENQIRFLCFTAATRTDRKLTSDFLLISSDYILSYYTHKNTHAKISEVHIDSEHDG